MLEHFPFIKSEGELWLFFAVMGFMVLHCLYSIISRRATRRLLDADCRYAALRCRIFGSLNVMSMEEFLHDTHAQCMWAEYEGVHYRLLRRLRDELETCRKLRCSDRFILDSAQRAVDTGFILESRFGTAA